MANAAKAKTWFKSFRIAYTKSGSPPIIVWRVAAAAIFEGDPVVISSNQISEAASNSGAIFGIALASITAAEITAGNLCPVYVGDENNVFVGQADDDSGTLADLPQLVDLVEGSDGWKIDVGGTTEQVIRVLDYVTGDDTSDSTTPGRFYFQIHRSQWNEIVTAIT